MDDHDIPTPASIPACLFCLICLAPCGCKPRDPEQVFRREIASYARSKNDMVIMAPQILTLTARGGWALKIPPNAHGAALTITGADPSTPATLRRGFRGGHLISVAYGAELRLKDISLDGNMDAFEEGSLLSVEGRLTISNGTVLRNNASIAWPGGVYVHNGGRFTMDGGEIGGNKGTGVYVDGGVYAMNGGAIRGNKHGGVHVRMGQFTMNGGAISDHDGCGVHVLPKGAFTMDAGEISGNKNSGVYVDMGRFTMNGGAISGNTAEHGWGGGVCVDGGESTMNGGTISGNDGLWGGGVCIIKGNFTMEGGEVSNNTASYFGGGVCVWGGRFTMDGGRVSNNTIQHFVVGGVYVLGKEAARPHGRSGGQFTRGDRAAIYGNTAGQDGSKIASDVYMER